MDKMQRENRNATSRKGSKPNYIRNIVISALGVLASVVFLAVCSSCNQPSKKKEEPTMVKKEESVKAWEPINVEEEINSGSVSDEVNYGYQLLTQTAKYLGPQAETPKMRLSGNNLNCTSCHLEGGNKRGAATWAGVTMRYPSFRSRSNAMGTIEDRINGCMERSMNGKKLDKETKEMKSMVAYMDWLGEGMTDEQAKEVAGFAKIEIPDKAVDLAKGKEVFNNRCIACHQKDGQGLKKPDFTEGYTYPPLWGSDSFNDGAGMHRVLTAAQYIKANMPYLEASLEHPALTDEEAFNVAGYINSFDRPVLEGKEKDFPDRKLKPVSTPYGPWADDFPAEQHKYGPFPPIIAFYKEKYDITKTK